MKEFKVEISGILNWALEGWKDYRENGLHVPSAVNMPPPNTNRNRTPWLRSSVKNVLRILWL